MITLGSERVNTTCNNGSPVIQYKLPQYRDDSDSSPSGPNMTDV